MADPLLDAIKKERAALHARLAMLAEMERKLKRTPRPPGIVVQPHAPAGTLKEAILDGLKGAGAITSAEIKKRISDAGYDRRINGQYFTLTLRSLVDAGILKKHPNGSCSTYELKRA